MKDTNQIKCLPFKNPQPQTLAPGECVKLPVGINCAWEGLSPGLGGQLVLWPYLFHSSTEGEEEATVPMTPSDEEAQVHAVAGTTTRVKPPSHPQLPR